MKRKQRLQSFPSVCNKGLLSATARHAGKRPSEQFSVSFLQTIYLKKKRVNFTQDRVLLSLNRIYYQSLKNLKTSKWDRTLQNN